MFGDRFSFLRKRPKQRAGEPSGERTQAVAPREDPARRDRAGRTPLHYAVGPAGGTERTRRVAELIEAGSDVNDFEDQGWRPLHFAAQYSGNAAVVALLLDAGAAVEVENFAGDTPLRLAKDEETVRLLRERGADPFHENRKGHSPVGSARGLADTSPTFIAFADLFDEHDRRQADTRASLHHAAGRGDVELIARLIGDGADVDGRDRGGRTPAHHAAYHNHAPALRLLLEAGAQADPYDRRDETPLLLAMIPESYSADTYDCVRLLLERGADPLQRKSAVGRPLGLAKINKRKRIVALCKQALAERDADRHPGSPLYQSKKFAKLRAGPKTDSSRSQSVVRAMEEIEQHDLLSPPARRHRFDLKAEGESLHQIWQGAASPLAALADRLAQSGGMAGADETGRLFGELHDTFLRKLDPVADGDAALDSARAALEALGSLSNVFRFRGANSAADPAAPAFPEGTIAYVDRPELPPSSTDADASLERLREAGGAYLETARAFRAAADQMGEAVQPPGPDEDATAAKLRKECAAVAKQLRSVAGDLETLGNACADYLAIR